MKLLPCALVGFVLSLLTIQSLAAASNYRVETERSEQPAKVP